ncbi:MFS transporter [Capillibacterium thermochitinicola]|uniref:MFS transporter n=1 Tax=Capillibacterium thermochitinicola TaxID=2699427 RepID=A0A8J6HYR2_9FIRM|nr:MFS transporter [Capillibacterium thermochitinicola]MBA2132133.1 MFS transporter [Capillibacterium thermochitinicola]
MHEKLSFRSKFLYGLTDLGFSIAYTIPAFYLLIFLTDVVNFPPALAGTLLLLAKIWDALIDPVIGHVSDRTKTRWGRRRPFLLWFAVPFGLAFSLIWQIPQVASPVGQTLIILGAIFSFITFFSLLSVPYSSLAPEMTRDYDERTKLNGYRMFFSIIGGLAAVLLPSYYFGLSPDLRYGYRVMGISLGVVLAVLPLFAFVGTEEKLAVKQERLPLKKGLRLVLANRPYILALITYLLTWVAIDIISAVFIYYLKYWLAISEENSNIIFGIIFIVAAVFLPFWVKYAERFGKKGSYFVGLGFLALIMLATIFIQPGQRNLVYLIAALAGIGVSAAHIIPLSIIPDTIEYDELRTGHRQEGIYFGLVTFMQQFATSGALFIVGLVLQWSGYVPNTAQSAGALLAIRLLLGLLPAVLIGLGVLVLLKFPIDRAYHARITQELAARATSAAGAEEDLGRNQ